MALDRQRIERKDFPIGRRGYDPDAVDAHLSALADDVDELKRSSRRRTETLAATASEQVRAIVEAAETSASEIQRQAEDEAHQIRAEASTEVKATRQQATAQAGEYVGRVSESTMTMLQRLEAMETELSALIESLRTGGNRLNADLQLLEGNLDEVKDAVAPRPRFEPEPQASPAALASEAQAPPAALGDVFEDRPELQVDGPAKVHGDSLSEAQTMTAGGSSPSADAPNGSEDTEGARLIALNMALNGSPRDETERYLAEHFKLLDRRGLLDEVYESVES